MPTVITGTRAVNTANAENQLKIDMSDKIYLLDEEDAPLLALMSRLGKEAATEAKVEWLEDVVEMDMDSTTAAEAVDSVAIDVAHWEYFKINDLVVVPRTGEVFRVSVSPSASPITVVRAAGSKFLAAPMVINEPLLIIGSAFAEGSGVGDYRSTVADHKFNYAEIFKDDYAVTGTQMKSALYGGNDLERQRSKSGKAHARRLERAFLFGDRNMAGTGTATRRLVGGLTFYIESKIMDLGAIVLTEELWNAFLRSLFEFGSSEKVVFCSDALLSAITGFGIENLTTRPGDSELGMNVTSYLTPFGKVSLIRHRMLKGDVFGYMGIGIDLENLQIKPFRDTEMNELQIGSDLTDSTRGQYISELSFKVAQEQTHAILKNFRV